MILNRSVTSTDLSSTYQLISLSISNNSNKISISRLTEGWTISIDIISALSLIINTAQRAMHAILCARMAPSMRQQSGCCDQLMHSRTPLNPGMQTHRGSPQQPGLPGTSQLLLVRYNTTVLGAGSQTGR